MLGNAKYRQYIDLYPWAKHDAYFDIIKNELFGAALASESNLAALSVKSINQ